MTTNSPLLNALLRNDICSSCNNACMHSHSRYIRFYQEFEPIGFAQEYLKATKYTRSCRLRTSCTCLSQQRTRYQTASVPCPQTHRKTRLYSVRTLQNPRSSDHSKPRILELPDRKFQNPRTDKKCIRAIKQITIPFPSV